MVAKRIDKFGGMIPLASRRKLPEGGAVSAVNAILRNGELHGIRQPRAIKTLTGVAYKKAYRIPVAATPSTPLWWPLISPYAALFPNPLVNDAFNRYVWIDNNGPGTAQYLVVNSLARMLASQPAIRLGVPAPTAAPAVSVAGGSGIVTTRAYVYTYVNIFGEEGAPSPPVSLSGFLNGTWNVASLAVPVDYVTRGIDKVRVYRTVTGSEGSEYYRVVEQAATTTTYADTRAASAVAQEGLILQSLLWREPEMMDGFLPMPNGFFAGWRGKNIFFSEPYRPWAWPVEYIVGSEFPIINAGVVDQTLVALTTKSPTMVSGSLPSAMTVSRTDNIEPCAAANSLVQSPQGVFYASPNGLIRISESGLENVTEQVIGREIWQTTYLQRMGAAVLLDSLYTSAAQSEAGVMFDFSAASTGVVDIVNTSPIEHIWTDPWTGEAHFIRDNVVYQWNAPSEFFSVCTWLSQEWQFIKPVNLGAFIVTIDPQYATGDSSDDIFAETPPPDGSPWLESAAIYNYCVFNGPAFNTEPAAGEYPPGLGAPYDVWPYWYGVEPGDDSLFLPPGNVCAVTVYADTYVAWTGLVQSGVMYRLPSGFKAELWQIQVKTRVPVLNLQIAETGKELANV